VPPAYRGRALRRRIPRAHIQAIGRDAAGGCNIAIIAEWEKVRERARRSACSAWSKRCRASAAR
jgi:hypothetical protein